MKQEKERLQDVYMKKANCEYFHATKAAPPMMQLCMHSSCWQKLLKRELWHWHQPDLCQSHTCQRHAVTVKINMQNHDQSDWS